MWIDSFLAGGVHMLHKGGGDEMIVWVGWFGDVSGDDCDTGEVGARYGDGVDVCESGVSISDCVVDGFVYDSGNATVVIGGAVFWSCVVKV